VEFEDFEEVEISSGVVIAPSTAESEKSKNQKNNNNN